MRQKTIITARAMIVLLFGAAILDVPLPSRSRARVRVHLLDLSGSALVEGPRDSITVDEALDTLHYDRANSRPEDTVPWAAFGKNMLFESRDVDPEGSDLKGALEQVLDRNPTEIVLYSDGRADPGTALFLCRDRKIPVHVVPLGPTSARDARIARVNAPAQASAGERVPLEATVEATFEGKVRLLMGSEEREITVRPGVPTVARFEREPGPYAITLEAEGDVCPQNNRAEGAIDARTDQRKILLLSRAPLSFPGYDVKRSETFITPDPYAVAVLDNVPLSPNEQKTLADYVRNFGGSLLLLGGAGSFGRHWKNTPIEEVSPVYSFPDQKVAVVFAIDASGSMSEGDTLETVFRAAKQARDHFLQETDPACFLAFGKETVWFKDFTELRKVRAEGGTFFAPAIREARLRLQGETTGRRHIILLTDGEPSQEEKAEDRKKEAGLLGNIKLTVVTTGKELEVGDQVPIKNLGALRAKLEQITLGIQQLIREEPAPLEPTGHPIQVPPVKVGRINLTTRKPEADVAATIEKNYPAVAFIHAGRGQVAAILFPFEPSLGGLYRDAIEHIAPESEMGLTLSLDPPAIRARGGRTPSFDVTWRAHPSGESGNVTLGQVARDLWEGLLPPTRPGTIFVRRGSAVASAAILPSEYQALGVDREALQRIADATGGTFIASRADLENLPRPRRPIGSGGRTAFLVAALVFLFLEMGLTTFWKP